MEKIKPVTVIEQPTFFPWCGYFGLISVSDKFVFYDDVQFERRSWQSRNRIISTDKDWIYINIPCIKAPREAKINEIYIVDSDEWKEEVLNKIRNAYGKSPFYNQYYPIIEKMLYYPCQKLVDLNIRIIEDLCSILGINNVTFMLASELNGINGTKTDRLINIMKKLGDKTYLSSTGAKTYIEAEKFRKEEIDLLWYEFIPDKYNQNRKEFVPYLSVVDSLFNIGATETKKYIEEIAKRSVVRHVFSEIS